jgi:response regulator NasT
MIAYSDMTTRSLRIAVADDEGFMRKYLQTILPRLGHKVVAVAQTGSDLVEQCRENRPDLVITDVNMPEMDGLDAAAAIYAAQPIPIIVISGYHGPEVIERTVAAHIMAYLVKPIKQSDLEPVIALAIRRFEQIQSLRKETADLRDTLQDRATVEQALRVLMRWAKQREEDALARLENLAADKNLQLVEIAQMILMAEDAIDPAERSSLPKGSRPD